jgi:multidrug efflux pump
MTQITGALVGIALVLSAVFLPMAFFGGSTGVIYRQFSITIASAMALSVVVALIFTPALCSTILKPVEKDHHAHEGGFFGWFNHHFDAGNRRYEAGVHRIVGRPGRYMLAYVAIVAVMGLLFTRIPTAFLPDEDQGLMFIQVNEPPGATSGRTDQTLALVRDYLLNDEKDVVSSIFTIRGFSFSGRGQNAGLAFVKLKDWGERPGKHNSVSALVTRTMDKFKPYKDAEVFAVAPPAVTELGNATGFDFELQDRGALGHEKMVAAREQFLAAAKQSKVLKSMRANGLPDEPQYKIDIDWERASAFGLTVNDINNTLSAAWGSAYVNQFIDRGRVKRVYIQGDASSRMRPEDFGQWYVRNAAGQMVPFSAFSSGHWIYGPPKLERYNGIASMQILGQPADGYSTGEAMAEVEKLLKQLPPGIGHEWTGLSFEERRSGSQAPALYAISLLIVFLCLAALYESWSIPASVMLVVPLGVVGAVLATFARGLGNDVYFQVGLLTTIGLSAKNAILIVEFAKANYDSGMGLIDATVHAAHQRLRPILMTSLAFILGVMPLAISTGAGSGGQNAIGTGVIGGMFTATVLAIFFVPVFFVVVRKLVERDKVRMDGDGNP